MMPDHVATPFGARVAPVVKLVDVPLQPRQAFTLFTDSFAAWWPLKDHALSNLRCGAPARTCGMECREGGEIFEVMANGERAVWGRITRWAPPESFVFLWWVGGTEETATEVEIQFSRRSEHGTRVRLEHRNWERLGEGARQTRDSYDGGWAGILQDAFRLYALKNNA